MKFKFKRFHCENLAVFSIGLYTSIVLLGSSKAFVASCDGVLDETNTTCYIYRSDVRTWQDSELICQSLGGHLVSVHSSAKQNSVRSVLLSQRVTSNVWLGGQLELLDLPATRLWRWISDCLHCGRDTNGDLAVSAQGCYKDQAKVHDLPYNISRLGRLLTPDACIEACRNGGFRFAGVQGGSQCFCGNSFGLYGSIDSAADKNNCVLGCSGNSSLNCGGTNLNFIFHVPGGYAEWGYAKPNNYKGYQTCTVIGQSIEFKFDDDDCGKTTAGFICDIPKTACINGAIQLNDTSCYYISTSESVSWFKAREDCLHRGGDLLKVKNQFQLKVLKSSQYLKSAKYWIGLVGRVWFWTNGDDLTYSNWYDAGDNHDDWEPNEVDNECMVISPEKNFQWMDSNCNFPHGYLCQISSVSTAQATTQHIGQGSSWFPVETSRSTSAGVQSQPKQGASTVYHVLTSVEKALIIFCVIFFVIVLIMILVMIFTYRQCANRNIIDGDTIFNARDTSTSPENTTGGQTPNNSSNHNREIDRIVVRDDRRKTRLVVK